MPSAAQVWSSIGRISGIGPKRLWKVADSVHSHGATIRAVLDNPNLVASIIGEPDLERALANAERDPVDSLSDKVTFLHPDHEAFPKAIVQRRHSMNLPALFYARGNVELLNRLGVAIVGSREAPEAAIKLVERLTEKLSQSNVVTISGHAKGIDTAAHTGALHSEGSTVIVLPEGINQFQPRLEMRSHFTTYNTCVLSQFEPNAAWSAHAAMARNPVIHGLSKLAVVIISGPERDNKGRMSGTFSGALDALKMNIPSFVVSPSYFGGELEGNAKLIRRGLIEWNPDDGFSQIMDVLARPNMETSQEVANTPSEIGSLEQLPLFPKV